MDCWFNHCIEKVDIDHMTEELIPGSRSDEDLAGEAPPSLQQVGTRTCCSPEFTTHAAVGVHLYVSVQQAVTAQTDPAEPSSRSPEHSEGMNIKQSQISNINSNIRTACTPDIGTIVC